MRRLGSVAVKTVVRISSGGGRRRLFHRQVLGLFSHSRRPDIGGLTVWRRLFIWLFRRFASTPSAGASGFFMSSWRRSLVLLWHSGANFLSPCRRHRLLFRVRHLRTALWRLGLDGASWSRRRGICRRLLCRLVGLGTQSTRHYGVTFRFRRQ